MPVMYLMASVAKPTVSAIYGVLLNPTTCIHELLSDRDACSDDYPPGAYIHLRDNSTRIEGIVLLL